MRDALDRFYTPDDIALKCVNRTLRIFGTGHSYIEPSAGDGAFVRALDDKSLPYKAFDISPSKRCAACIEQIDFFDIKCDDVCEHAIYIGNPPFGERTTMATSFIKHCIDLSADGIAFVLPMTFDKLSKQRVFPDDWRLIDELSLGMTSFNVLDHVKRPIKIPVVFQIWTCQPDVMPQCNLRKIKPKQPSDYIFVKRQSSNADFCVNGNSGLVKKPEDVTNPKAEHYIRSTDRAQSSIVCLQQTFQTIHDKHLYTPCSSVNGGNYWLNKDDLNNAYLQFTSRQLSTS